MSCIRESLMFGKRRSFASTEESRFSRCATKPLAAARRIRW